MQSLSNQNQSNKHFQDLMLHRVHDILLVASPYDAFILEEDGRLTEQILHEYLGMNLSYAPRVWQANTASYAMDLLSRRSVDLIIVMMRISDMELVTFGKRIKEAYSKKPIILLAFDESEIRQLPEKINDFLDNVFVWSGNSNVFPAIIKHVEDLKNVKRDTRKGDIRSIIYIEDTPRYYSSILPLIYKETLFHTKQLIDKSLNNTQRLLHMRGRPKVLLAQDYESAKRYFKNYKNNILGIISDIRFPKDGELNSNAGIIFSKYVHSIESSLPILLISNEKEALNRAKELTLNVLDKNSLTLFSDIRDFMVENFGFGDFIFRLQNGKKIGQIGTVEELLDFMKKIPEESLNFHAANNHFSNWLAARGEFSLASSFRRLKSSDFTTINERINHHVDLIKINQQNKRVLSIAEFRPNTKKSSANFVRIGTGSLGGKARGLAFANSYWNDNEITKKYENITFKVPKIAVVSTDEFDEFMEVNELWEIALSLDSNIDIENTFLNANLSNKLVKTLKDFIDDIKFPLAVRSSSLLEDSQYQPLAGMYSTFMLSNSHRNKTERLKQLCEAIKRVYASTFFQEPKTLMENIVHRHEEEKMAVIIMEMIGQKYEEYFYPTISGVAQSYNYYPISYMQRDEGIAFTALGLGRTIVEGGKALRFSPKYPNILPQFHSIKSTIANSQNSFYALNMLNGKNTLMEGEEKNLEKLDLKNAELHGSLKNVASVVCSEDGIIRDSLHNKGKRVLLFAPILKYVKFPLAEIIEDILDKGKESLGCPVEIEFAVNIFDDSLIKDEFCLLQIKPMVMGSLEYSDNKISNDVENQFCTSNIVLGDGVMDSIKNIIYVYPDSFDQSFTQNIANEIEIFNRKLGKDNPYILIGPGRWGTADPWLGIPVNWKQISNARIIIEIDLDENNPDPSFGSHFFQNVTSLRIGYFTIQKSNANSEIDLDWIESQPVKQSSKYIRWYQLEEPLTSQINGRTGEGCISKTKEKNIEVMDEEESSGI